MASPTCPVNCSIRPDKLTPYPDISGIGVNLSYTITAGLALCLVLAYYILAYRPDISPFGEATKGTSTASFEIIRPNPIDNCLLFWRIGKHGNGPIVNSSVSDNRIRSALIRCMLIISDFQLIAGLSTLISGFAQLRCGISTYHWQKIVRLAWFASISHLCCLTFLRDYFCKRRGAQTWRIPGMVLLIIMLIAALVPTAGYDFNRTRSSHVSPFDSAVCAYIPHATSPEADYMVFSALLLAFGMVIRICRLYPKPLHMFENLRGRCHEISHKYLRKVHKHTHSRSFASFLVDMCYYKPLLAIDISCRMALDVATSKAFEVWWLVVSFGWGVLNLWNLNNYSGWDVEEPDSLDWTFGQVIAVLGLLAPIAALIEGYFDNLHEKSPGSVEDPHEMTTDTLPQLASHNPSQQNIPQTESQNSQPVEDAIVPDVYSKSGSFQPLIYAWLMCIATTTSPLTLPDRYNCITTIHFESPFAGCKNTGCLNEWTVYQDYGQNKYLGYDLQADACSFLNW
ncbi:Nn.00g011950.m01.CDS01 [Neocucurbitaria sp. VM-36]